MTPFPTYAPEPKTFSGVTFAASPNKLLAPMRRTLKSLGLAVSYQGGKPMVAGRKLAKKGPILPDGTRLVSLADLRGFGVTVSWDGKENRARLSRKGKVVYVRRGAKKVKIDKTRQELVATQGGLVFLRSPISTGRRGKGTPNGTFRVQPYKARLHLSKLYDNAPMPYAVQIVGNIFVHGYTSVPNRPASNGCIRLPLVRPAKGFYDWAETGTPVYIEGQWRG